MPLQYPRFDELHVYSGMEFADRDILEKYSICVYNALLQLFGNDIGPPNIPMIWFGALCLICGMVMEANVMATITDIMSAMGIRSTKFQETIDMVNTNMKDLRLPEDTQKEIREFMFTT